MKSTQKISTWEERSVGKWWLVPATWKWFTPNITLLVCLKQEKTTLDTVFLVHSSVGTWKSPLYPHTKNPHPGDFPHVRIRVESSRVESQSKRAGKVECNNMKFTHPPFGALPFRCHCHSLGCQSGDSKWYPNRAGIVDGSEIRPASWYRKYPFIYRVLPKWSSISSINSMSWRYDISHLYLWLRFIWSHRCVKSG